MKTSWPEHGGKTSVITSLLHEKGLQTEKIKDFSANINPFGIPPIMLESMKKAILESSVVYPDLTYRDHTEKVATFEGVENNQVLLTNGGAEAIHLTAKLLRNKKVALFHPSFSEYELACKAHDVDYACFLYEDFWNECKFPSNIEDIVKEFDAVYVCRPNNPSGTCVAYSDLIFLLEITRQNNTMLIVDEAFIHFAANEQSIGSFVKKHEHLIVLRSLTKIFAVPGIRLGYIMANERIINELSTLQIPWSVNSVALSLIDCLPQCKEFVAYTVNYIHSEKEWLFSQLQSLQFDMSNTCTNFYLLRDPSIEDHEPLLLYLVEKGILSRHTYNFLGLSGSAIRLAIRTTVENEELVRYLREWREKKVIVFISGGARSGKSSFAEQIAIEYYEKSKASSLCYIATAERNNDEEMSHRIQLHKEGRSSLWETIEEPFQIDEQIKKVPDKSVLLIDCLTVWSSNVIFLENKTYEIMINRLKNVCKMAKEKQLTIVFVSNDLNEEIPIQDEGVQNYVYSLQTVHKYIVSQCDTAIQVIAGFPFYWKGSGV